jgi:hypothetical protein
MKTKSAKIGMVIICLVLGVTKVWGQGQRGVDIIPYFGYSFGGKVNGFNAEGKIVDSEAYGVAVDFALPFREGAQLELMWYMQPTRLDVRVFPQPNREPVFDMDVHYIQIGGIYGIQQDNILPYGTFSLGATIFHPKTNQFSDEWRFSATLGLGAKVYLSERVGIRLDGRLLLPFTGGALWVGTGGVSAGATSSIIQGNVNGGLIISL